MASTDSALAPEVAPVPRLVDQFEHGLDAPICLTWELTYACHRRASATRAS
jgi:MoaA/NifB/PqqE/SkfB family radical SAM enzyme